MSGDAEKGLLIALGMPEKDSEDEEDGNPAEEAELQAADEVMSAVKKGDKSALRDALKAFMIACESGYEDEPEESEAE